MALTAIIVLAALAFVVLCYALQCAFYIAIFIIEAIYNLKD